MPTISVITAVLNDRGRFATTAQHVVAQRGGDFEWIVVDGGSGDGTLDEIRRFEPWIAAWQSRPDRGVYDAMNRGLALARGEFVVFMNAGDGFPGPDTLATVAAALRRAADVDLLFGGVILLLPRRGRVYRPPRAASWLRWGLPACHQATYVRRALHLAVPHDLGYRISSDYYTIARMCRAGARTLCLDVPLALHDFGPHNLSRRETLARFRDFVAVQRAVLKQGWPAVALNTGRLLWIHCAYQAVTSIWLGALADLLLRPWRPQPELER